MYPQCAELGAKVGRIAVATCGVSLLSLLEITHIKTRVVHFYMGCHLAASGEDFRHTFTLEKCRCTRGRSRYKLMKFHKVASHCEMQILQSQVCALDGICRHR